MIERESTGDGWQVRFPPSTGQQILRIAMAVFLSLWLCGWAMGEYFAAGALTRILVERYAPGSHFGWLPGFHVPAGNAAFPVAAFLGVWLLGWTAGGCFAIGSLLMLLFGVPMLRWCGAGAEMVTQVGPFAGRRRLTWEQAEALVSGAAAPQLPGGKLRALAVPAFEAADRDALLGWLREARASTPGAGGPEANRAIG